MTKVLVIGATGTIGKAVMKELERDCDVIEVGGTSGEHTVDIASTESIVALYQKFKDVDAVVCAAARGVAFKPLTEMTKAVYLESLQGKQLGQIDLVLQGLKYLGSHVSYTLTTGLLGHDPILLGTAAAMVNTAVEGFMCAAAIDMPGKQRINVVSPNVLTESVQKYEGFFEGFVPVPGAAVALAYRKSVLGAQTGQVIKVGW
jgi:NAD(P)-dependent dehydrogenase (short-subunit alcohol dehydrogenase family)